jgi:outer membrane protein
VENGKWKCTTGDRSLLISTFHFSLSTFVVLALSGCASPFGRSDADYGRRPPAERLREIDRLPLESFVKPAPTAPPKPEDAAKAARDKFAAMPEVPLTIEEARASALTNNLDLKISLMSPSIAKESVTAEEAAFEATFSTRALWRETDSATASTLVNAQEDFALVEPGVTLPLRTGGTASVSLPMSRVETNNAFSTLNPAYTTDLAFSISHPLLRNAGREVNATAITIASYNLHISESQTKLAIINQLAAVDRAYWRLYQARRDLEVRQQQWELAQAQLERAQRLVNSGRRAEIELVRAQSGVADRLDAIIVAQNQLLRRQREFKRLINMPGLEIDNTSRLITRTDPRPVEYLFEPVTLANAAEQNRMEMMELELRLLSDAANIKFNRNQMLPQLDVNATYTINGLGGTLDNSFDTLERNNFEDWSVGATFSTPIGNTGPRARYRQSVLTRVQRIGSRESRKQTIRQEVLDAVDAIEAGWQRILATRQATILSARTLAAEQRQFDVGASTSTDVLDAATNLAQSQLAEILAVTDYEVAQVDLAVATGTLLGAQKIRWEPADTAVPESPDAHP